MSFLEYAFIKPLVGVILTLGLYSMLYRENKLYRVCEHIFLGLASGYALVAMWTETLKAGWWDKMIGTAASPGHPGQMGYWIYAILAPIGLMAYFVFSKKHNWISRIPVGIIIGLYSGQQFQAWQNRYIDQVSDSVKPVVPTTSEFFRPSPLTLTPDQLKTTGHTVFVSDAVSNLIFVITVLCVLCYFLFSFEVNNKLISRASLMGRWLLMIGFGAIFGSTVMMRFSLLIDRMAFVFDDFLREQVWHQMLHR